MFDVNAEDPVGTRTANALHVTLLVERRMPMVPSYTTLLWCGVLAAQLPGNNDYSACERGTGDSIDTEYPIQRLAHPAIVVWWSMRKPLDQREAMNAPTLF